MTHRRVPDEWVPFSRLVEEGEMNDPPAKLVRLEQGRGRLLKRLFRKMDPAVPPQRRPGSGRRSGRGGAHLPWRHPFHQ